MWFGILGPLLVHDGDAVVGVPAARQRVLLAALLVRAGSAVPADALAELVWDGAPPAGAAGTLRSHMARLRRVLGPRAGSRLVTRYPGYLIEADEQEVDLLRFACLYREGGAAVRARVWEQASERLGEALGLWRGEPLADIPCGLLHRAEVPGLEQLRLQALEWRIDAGLHLGRHAELAAELQALAVQHPLRERFHAQLMLALYRCGRQVEALATYQQARQVLIEEFGTEPGTGLRELHHQLLTADPALEPPEPERLATANRGRVMPLTGPREPDPAPAEDVTSASYTVLPASFENVRRRSGRARVAAWWPGGKQGTAGTEPRPDRRRPGPAMPAWTGWALAGIVLVAAGVILGAGLGGPGSQPSPALHVISQPPTKIPLPCGASAPSRRTPAACMSTSDGGQNTSFVVQASGFSPGASVKVTLTVFSQPPPRQIFHGTAPGGPVVGKNGTFRYVIGGPGAFFTGPLPLGLYEVSATESGGHQASTAFRVVPSP